MTWVSTSLGTLLVVAAIGDLFMTAISVGHGAGPIAGRIADWIWRPLLWIKWRTGWTRQLLFGGPAILLAITTTWVMLLILGWSLIFGGPETLLTVQDGKPVPVVGRLRYAATLVIGRGSSSVQPAVGFYEVLEPVAAATGVTVLSLSIAYVIPVVQGVVAKRSLALYLSTLGRTPAEILRRAWNGNDLGSLDLHLVALVPRVAQVAQSHLAYPIIHFFHASSRETALGPSLVAVDEAITAHAQVDESVRMDVTTTAPLRRAVDDFLDTLRLAFIRPADVDVATGDDRMRATMSKLEGAGLPLERTSRDDLTEEEVTRNRLLRGYLVHDGWGDADALDLTADVDEDVDEDADDPAPTDEDAVEDVDDGSDTSDSDGHDGEQAADDPDDAAGARTSAE